MIFEKYVAIDWSGAQKPLATKKIQVAEYDSGNCRVSLVPSPSKGKWSRADVFEYVRRRVAEERVLIGFDFAFAYPYCDKGAYFPCEPTSPPDVQHLWGKVEEICSLADNFYGGPFYKCEGAPFKDFYLDGDFRGSKYEPRYRVTDERAKKAAGHMPSSVFKCVGPDQVGPGSVAGMRFLHKVRRETNASLWPFDGTDVPKGSTVVEIYPRIFLNCAGIGHGESPAGIIKKVRNYYGAALQQSPVTNDERDALVSAAGMGCLAPKPSTWEGLPAASRYEGWIFGVE